MKASWNDFAWPAWVPQRVRDQVEDFWSPSSGRGPDDWQRSSADRYSDNPPHWARVMMRDLGEAWIIGRYVHAWNNMGRLVLDDGTIKVVSSCDWSFALAPGSFGAHGSEHDAGDEDRRCP